MNSVGSDYSSRIRLKALKALKSRKSFEHSEKLFKSSNEA